MRVAALLGCVQAALLRADDDGQSDRQGSGMRAGLKQKNMAPLNMNGRGKYATLVDNFGNMKAVAEEEQGRTQGRFAEKTGTCAQRMSDLAENIKGYSKKMKDAQEAADNAQKKIDGLNEKIQKDSKMKSDMETMKQGGQAKFEETMRRMTFDKTKLQSAQGALDEMFEDKTGKYFGNLSGAAASRMQQTIGNLRTRVNQEFTELDGAITNGRKYHASSQGELFQSITSLGNSLMGDKMSRDSEVVIRNNKRTEAGNAKTSLGDETKTKIREDAACKENLRTLSESIDDDGERIAALDKAIGILGESAAAPDAKEERKSTIAGGALGTAGDFGAFVQTSFLAKPDPRKRLAAAVQILEMKNSRAAAILRSALEVSPKQQEAFNMIIAEIHNMFNEMEKEDADDIKTQTECQENKNQLESDLKSQTDDRNKLQAEHDSIVAFQGVLQTKMKKANGEHATAAKDMVHNTQLIQQDIADNNQELQELKADLMNLQRAEGVLGNEFKNRFDGMSKMIMKLITDLVVEYEASVTHSEREDRTLGREQESNEKNGRMVMKQQDRLHKRLSGDHQAKDERKTVVETDRRDVKAELRATETAMRTIFTQKDGHCHKFKDVYPARIKHREGERKQLKDAKDSLKEYMTSIGIRVN